MYSAQLAHSKFVSGCVYWPIQNHVQTKSNGEIIKIKVVDLNDFYKFFAYDLFI